MMVRLKDGTNVETDNLVTVEQIQPVLDDLQLQIDTMEAAVGIMGAQYAGRHGKEIPRSFYQSKFMLKRLRREAHILTEKIKMITRGYKRERRLTFEHYFVQIAELRLAPDVYESICSDAKRLLDEALQVPA